MRISDWSSDCALPISSGTSCSRQSVQPPRLDVTRVTRQFRIAVIYRCVSIIAFSNAATAGPSSRSEEHTSELQSLMRIQYAVFCLTKKIKTLMIHTHEIFYTRITDTLIYASITLTQAL